jgi:hypothetical protein
MITAAYFIPIPSDFAPSSVMGRLRLLGIIEKDINAFRCRAAAEEGLADNDFRALGIRTPSAGVRSKGRTFRSDFGIET